MKRSSLIITIALAAFTVLPISAKKKAENLLPNAIYGFEMNGNAWWTNAKDAYQITSEKAATGEKCLKYSVADLSAYETKNIAMQGGNKKKQLGLVTLEPGTYTISMKVWVSADKAPLSFTTNIKKPFVGINWKLKNVDTEQWVNLTQEIVIEEAVKASSLVVAVSTNIKRGGTGTFYIDDIAITK